MQTHRDLGIFSRHSTHRIRATRILVAVACALVAAQNLVAQPTLTVTNSGPNVGGNLEWVVEIAPDASLFTNTDLGFGGSLAVELAFEILNTDLVGVTVNNTDWPLDIPGNNPFTNSASTGVDLDLTGDTVFASLLSNFFLAANPVEVFTIETSGTDCTTLLWGGHTLLGGTADEYEGSLIAQAGQNFTAYQGTASEPAGDFDADCDVDGADLMEWQQHYDAPYNANDLSDWENNYGTVLPLQASVVAVPEPTTLLVALACLPLALVLGRTRSARATRV